MRSTIFLLLVGCFSFACSTVTAAAPKEPIASDAAPSQPPEDRPQPLVPKKPRTEADENRVQAEALLATARTMEQRQESAAALRLYERAFRLDPQAVAALEEIVPLAFSLNRRDESLRYAVKLAEQDTSDPDLPRRIGMYLAENGDWKPAIKLLQRSVKVMQTAGKPAAERIAVEAELARLDFLRRNTPIRPRCSTKSPPRWPSPRISASMKRPGAV